MSMSSIVSVVLATALGVAACTTSHEVNAERTAACADRTNAVACSACCKTSESPFKNNVCTCIGKAEPPK